MTVQFKKVAVISGMLLSVATISLPTFAADAMVGTGGYARQLQKMEMMKMLDADGNHMVTAAEADTYYNSVFDALNKDSDGDHKVTREEFLNYHKAVFAKLDTSSDQELTATEWSMKGLLGK